MDFLWVISGKITFKLHDAILNGIDCQTKSMYLSFQEEEYVDVKTITDEKLRRLKNPNIRSSRQPISMKTSASGI